MPFAVRGFSFRLLLGGGSRRWSWLLRLGVFGRLLGERV